MPAQNYEKLRRECLQKGVFFEDPYFPADDRSLFFSQKLPFKPEWKRPHVSNEAMPRIMQPLLWSFIVVSL